MQAPKPNQSISDDFEGEVSNIQNLKNHVADHTLHPRDGVYKGTSTKKTRKRNKRERQNRKQGRRRK